MCTCSTDDGRTALAVFNLGLIISILVEGMLGWVNIIIIILADDNYSRGRRIHKRISSNNDILPSCVEDDVEGVVRCVCWC